MEPKWERRDRKKKTKKIFREDNRKSVRFLYTLLRKKSEEVKNGNK